MSVENDSDDATTYSPFELREMDDDEARRTLTVDQYERREKLLDLHDQAEQTREEWAEQDQQVAEITVSADMDDLGTEVAVFGNDLLVRVDPEDDDIRDAAENIAAIEDDVGDIRNVAIAADEDDDTVSLENADAKIDILAGALVNLFDAIILKWDGVEWADLPEAEREAVLADARRDWGIDGLVKAYIDIMAALREDREERMDVIESFRSEERASGRGDPPADRFSNLQ